MKEQTLYITIEVDSKDKEERVREIFKKCVELCKEEEIKIALIK